MLNLKNTLFIVCITLTATACTETPHTETYLLQHPRVLEKDLRFCMSNATKSAEEMRYCAVVAEAQDKIRDYLDAQQTDPEKFGERIMETEAAFTQLKAEFLEAKQRLQAKKASPAELPPLQDQLIRIEKNYREKQQELNILLAVIGLSSP